MIKPKQRISFAEKNTKEWKEANAWYYYENCTGKNLSRAELARLYRIANGHLDESEYSYVRDPLGVASNRPELSGSPAKIKNMDIISPVILRLMGEKTKRPNQFIAFAKNSDFPSQKSEKQKKMWSDNIQLDFINELIRNGQFVPGMTDPETGQPIEEPKSPEAMQMELASMTDLMSIMVQEALEYISYFNELPRIFRKGFYDWCVTNTVFSYKDVRYDDTVYESIPPEEIEWEAAPEIDFLEDGDAVKRTRHLSINTVIDNFRDIDGMTNEILDDLEAFGNLNIGTTEKFASQSEVFYSRMFGERSIEVSNGDTIEVCHIVHKSQKKIKRVTGTNILGETYTLEYDEDYEPIEGEKVEESWHSQVWEHYILGGKWVVGSQPIPIVRESMSNPSAVKLPYNGRIFHARSARAKSLVEKGETYQAAYNTGYYLLQKMMNKNKDKLTILPLGLIPDKAGWDEMTTMYYADAMGFIFVDDADPAKMQSLQYVKTLDMSLGQYIQFMHQHLAQIKNDWEELAGISRERKAQTMASQTNGNAQANLSASIISTEEHFVEYDEFEEKDLQGLLDISKYAFINGKKATYISSDRKLKYLEIIPEAYMNIDMGVFVRNGGQEAERLREFKESAFAFAQNNMKPSVVAQVVSGNNLEKLVLEMKEAEAIIDQAEQQKQQALNQIEKDRIDMEAKKALDELNFKYYKVDADNTTKKEINLMQPSPVDETGKVMSNEAIERGWQEIEREKAILKATSDKYKADSAERVARINPG
jgi:hypothetical protein